MWELIYDFLHRFAFCSCVLLVAVYVAVFALIAYSAYAVMLVLFASATFLGRLVKSATIVELVEALKKDIHELK